MEPHRFAASCQTPLSALWQNELVTADAITLRLAEPRDAEAIAVLSRDIVESGLGWHYRPASVRCLMADPETVVLVTCVREQLVGFAAMEFGDERAHLVLLAVRADHQRRGIGRSMINWLLESALTAGIASVHLELRHANETARAFYHALGFAETILVPGYYQGREAALRMLRVLRAPGPQQ